MKTGYDGLLLYDDRYGADMNRDRVSTSTFLFELFNSYFDVAVVN